MVKRKVLLTVAVVFCVILATWVVLSIRFGGYCGTSNRPLPTLTPAPKTTPNVSANSVVPPASGYLEDTKIYFVSANYSYGIYPEDLVQHLTNITVIRRGDPCFNLNLTLRNDYTDNETFPSRWGDNGGQSFGYAFIMLEVSFYDANGVKMNTTNVTHASVPFDNRDAFSIHNSETDILHWVFAIPNYSVDHFNVTIRYLGPVPVP